MMAVWNRCSLQAGLLVVAAVGFLAVQGERRFYLGSCGANNGRRDLMTFANSEVSPHPIILPGDFSVTSTLRVFGNVTGDLDLDLTVERHFGFFDFRVPCIQGVGSCLIRDVCGMLRDSFGDNAGCPPQFLRDGVPCTCPLAPGTYTMRGGVFSVSYLNSLWTWLAQGDYRATARLIDRASGETISCQRLDVTIGTPCTSFFCRLFG